METLDFSTRPKTNKSCLFRRHLREHLKKSLPFGYLKLFFHCESNGKPKKIEKMCPKPEEKNLFSWERV